jgi:paraquat-inducible protein B
MKTDPHDSPAPSAGRDDPDAETAGQTAPWTPAPDWQPDRWFHDLPRAIPVPVAPAGPWRDHAVPSLVWLVPALVILVGGWLTVRAVRDHGPSVTITFSTADGVEANKTTVRYKGVSVGVVKTIALREDHPGVVATVELSPQMTRLLVEDARFWVVRPRVSAAGISGMNTLLGGVQIAFDPGLSSRACRAFRGLDAEPSTTSDRRGRRIRLRAESPGSLEVGSPVYLRRVQVGQVTRVALEPSGDSALLEASIDVFIDAPYDSRITKHTRFWNASGVDVTVDLRGLRVDTQSLASILAGGIAFEPSGTPEASGPTDATARQNIDPGPDTSQGAFTLFASRDAALRGPTSRSNDYRLVFDRSIRGLDVGARVELLGSEVGEVRQVEIELDATTGAPRTEVLINLSPDLLHLILPGDANLLQGSSPGRPASADDLRRLLVRLVQGGNLRAEVRTGNLLTNQRYVAFEREPGAGPAKVDWTARPVSLPTSSSAGDRGLGGDIQHLVATLDHLPLGRLTTEATSTFTEMRSTLESVSRLTRRVDEELVPRLGTTAAQSDRTLAAVERTLASDSPLQRDLHASLRELTAAAQAIRVLAETVNDHPESLVWGRKKGSRK